MSIISAEIMGICLNKTPTVTKTLVKAHVPPPITQDTHIGQTEEGKTQATPAVHRTKYKRTRKRGSASEGSEVPDSARLTQGHGFEGTPGQPPMSPGSPCLYSAHTRPSSVSSFPQDGFSVAFEGSISLLAVFAGTGITGGKLSDYAKATLPSLVLTQVDTSKDASLALKAAIREFEFQLIASSKDPDSQIDCENSGITVSLVLIRDRKMYIAHVGDSRILLGKAEDGQMEAEQLTIPHTPHNERKRLENYNCEIKTMSESKVPRLYTKGTDVPGLSVSRSIGYTAWTNLGVCSEVEVLERDMQCEDEFVVISSAGVNEVVGKEEMVEVVKANGGEDAAEKITQLAWSRRVHMEGEVVEDLTALVCYLPKR